MSERRPGIAGYLSRLPAGIASYPECTVKASVFRHALMNKPLGPEIALPDEVRALVDHPPPVSAWIPEVHFNVLSLALRDAYFAADDLDGYLAWVFEQNRRLLATPLYRAVFLLISPGRLLTGVQRRWGTFRQGTELSIHRQTSNEVELRLLTPPFLQPTLTLQGLTMAFRAALERAGGRDPRGEGKALSSTENAFWFTWR